MRRLGLGLIVWSIAAAGNGCGNRDPEPEIRITRNYAAEINAEIEKIPEEDRAWPVYLDAYFEIGLDRSGTRDELERLGDDDSWDIDAASEFVSRHAASIGLIRQAAGMPALGAVVSRHGNVELTRRRMSRAMDPITDDGADDNPMVAELLLPHPTILRDLQRVQRVDLRRAAEAGDAESAAANLRASLGLTRHVSEPPVLVAAMSRSIMFQMAMEDAFRVLAYRPDLLSTEQLRAVLESARRSEPGAMWIRMLELETMLYLDVMQRTYTDDGNGDGVMTEEGMRLLIAFQGDAWARGELSLREAMVTIDRLNPADVARLERQATRRKSDEFRAAKMKHAEALFQGEPWRRETWTYTDRWAKSKPDPDVDFFVYSVTLPALDRAAQLRIWNTATLGALGIMVEAEVHRRLHGEYPQSSEDFAPEIRSQWPPDPIDGAPLRYTIREGSPVVYSVGFDRDDDRGTHSEEASPRKISDPRWQEFFDRQTSTPNDLDGDWVLFPPNPS